MLHTLVAELQMSFDSNIIVLTVASTFFWRYLEETEAPGSQSPLLLMLSSIVLASKATGSESFCKEYLFTVYGRLRKHMVQENMITVFGLVPKEYSFSDFADHISQMELNMLDTFDFRMHTLKNNCFQTRERLLSASSFGDLRTLQAARCINLCRSLSGQETDSISATASLEILAAITFIFRKFEFVQSSMSRLSDPNVCCAWAQVDEVLHIASCV